MNIASKISALLGRLVGPNSAHVIDALIAWELTAVAAGFESQSARDYAVNHPLLVVVFTVGPPVLTGFAAKFRKAAGAKSAALAAAPRAPVAAQVPTPDEAPAAPEPAVPVPALSPSSSPSDPAA
jgi:hypothetical protein